MRVSAHQDQANASGWTQDIGDDIGQRPIEAVDCVSEADDRFRVARNLKVSRKEERVSVGVSLDHPHEHRERRGYVCIVGGTHARGEKP